jgi:predicted AAA+ superfamily ATPase
MVIEQILAILPAGIEPFFYRTSAGAEVDLLLVPRGGAPIAVEIKHSLSPKVSNGLRSVMADLKCERGYIVYPGTETYQMTQRITALPVTMLKEIVP